MSIEVGIIGGGGWGTAVARLIALKRRPAGAGDAGGNASSAPRTDNTAAAGASGPSGAASGAPAAQYHVTLWCHDRNVADEINGDHVNAKHLPGVPLPSELQATSDLREAADNKHYLIFCTPSLFLLDYLRRVLEFADVREGRCVIGVLTKGFISTDRGVGLILDVMEDYLPGFYRNNLVYISGPSQAEEVGRGKLTGLISASMNPKNSIRFRRLLSGPTTMVFSSLDVVGVQICAAVKNVIAIAFGILDALKELTAGFGDNTESLLLAAGLNEIQRLAFTLGATHPETFTSIAGVGDLDVTCRSPYGRNRRFGRAIVLDRAIARFRDIDDLLAHITEFGYFPEGAAAARNVDRLIRKHALKMPISNGVFRILNREIEPIAAIRSILENLTGAAFEGFGDHQHDDNGRVGNDRDRNDGRDSGREGG